MGDHHKSKQTAQIEAEGSMNFYVCNSFCFCRSYRNSLPIRLSLLTSVTVVAQATLVAHVLRLIALLHGAPLRGPLYSALETCVPTFQCLAALAPRYGPSWRVCSSSSSHCKREALKPYHVFFDALTSVYMEQIITAMTAGMHKSPWWMDSLS